MKKKIRLINNSFNMTLTLFRLRLITGFLYATKFLQLQLELNISDPSSSYDISVYNIESLFQFLQQIGCIKFFYFVIFRKCLQMLFSGTYYPLEIHFVAFECVLKMRIDFRRTLFYFILFCYSHTCRYQANCVFILHCFLSVWFL